MKTLVFFGSPRAGGDTAQLVRALTGGLPGEPIWVDAYRAGISPCVDCRACMVRAGCAIDDPMTDVYRQIEEADAIAVASPVHFSGLSGPLLSLFGRLQTYYCARRFRGVEPIQKPKRGAILLAAGGDGAPERAIEQARELLKNMGARDIAPPVVSGATDDCPAEKDAAALSKARALAGWLAGAPRPATVIRPVDAANRGEVNRFIGAHWHATDMALRGRLVDLTVAEGFAAYEGDQLIGLVTCALTGEDCEILSLDSLRPGEGLGGRLMRRAIDWAAERGAARVVLITTNDNTDALRFYQRMGFDLVRLGRNALRVSRRLKPSIPLTGEHGIPLRHELELALPLTRRVEDVKRGLASAEAAPLLAASMFDPTPSRVAERARALQADPNAAAWGLYERAKLIGLIAVDRSEPGAARVRAIAVAEGARRSGVGAALVRHAGRMLAPGALIAETDDDAVGFYRKTGFSVEPLGEVYPGVRRYRCALNLPDGPGPRVEPLTAGDEGWIAQAAALLAQAFPHCYGEAGEAWSEVLDCLNDGRVALVALCGGSVVGFGGSRPHYGGNAWELHPLAIDAAHRRQGVGRLLVAALERAAAGRGGRVMYLGADDEFGRTSLSDGDLFDHTPDKLARIENRGGHPYSFYEKLGYRVVGALPDANGPRRPDIWMAKRI